METKKPMVFRPVETSQVRAFGQPVTPSVVKSSKAKDFSFDTQDEEGSDKRGWFGNYVIANLEFPSGQYKDLDGNVISFNGVRIDGVLLTVNQQRLVVKTKIHGRNGTVKQYISEGDYEIEATGVIVGSSSESSGNNFTTKNEGNTVPQSELRKLKAILAVPQEIQIASDFLDVFDISYVVPEYSSFQQVEGSQKEIKFVIKMASDLPVELV